MQDSLNPVSPAQVPLWRQLQGAASVLLAVRDGQSMTPALDDVDAALRPGVQALAFHALRWLGRAEALRQQLAILMRTSPRPRLGVSKLLTGSATGWTSMSGAGPRACSRPSG